MIKSPFNLKCVHPSWHACLERAISKIDPAYLKDLAQKTWLPGPEKIFNAFSLPLNKVNFVLFGESPYPRMQSANGYAFWDEAVTSLWSETGLDKKVNRATSLRNLLKMLLIAEELLDENDTGQPAIAALNKNKLIQTNAELFDALIQHGFLLLNATPILQSGPPAKDARAWLPFTAELLNCLIEARPNVQFILFGRIAATIDTLIKIHPNLKKLYAEHPYNLSFVTNPQVLDFFKPFHLLRKKNQI